MLSTDLRALADWASGRTPLDDVQRTLLVQRLEAAADRAAAIEASIVPARSRGVAAGHPNVVRLDARTPGR